MTDKQLETLNLYAGLMEEIKIRIACVNVGTTGQIPLPPPIVKETCYLQLRLICELIALACLVAHGDVNQSSRLRKEWAADKIIDEMSRLHPHFFPRPIKTERSGPNSSHITPRKTTLDQQGLVDLYYECGGVLHRGSIKKLIKQNATVQVNYPDITRKLQSIEDMLGQHMLSSVNGEMHFICTFRDTRYNERTTVFSAERTAEEL